MKHYATYSRSNDCFPANAPDTFIKGSGCHVTADDGREFIDWGMALRACILGYCNPKVDEAAKSAIDKGVCFTRSNPYEGELREIITQELKLGEVCKFGKNGSDATHAAVKLARAYTGRDIVLIAEENPFISTADFFIGSTVVSDGIPKDSTVVKYSYNNLTITGKSTNMCTMESHNYTITLDAYIMANSVAAIILDPATVDVTKEKLQYIRDLCDKYGIIFILDETISGFRYDLRGVQGLYNVKPDLACYGKGMGNGYAVSCLAGKKELFDLGLRSKGNVFFLSGTYFSNTPDLAAAIATIRELRERKVTNRIWAVGRRFAEMLKTVIYNAGMNKYMQVNDFIPCNPSIVYATYDDNIKPLEIKTLFDQEMIRQGVLMPYISISWSHGADEANATVEAAYNALIVCKKTIDNGNVKDLLQGRHCEAPVFRRI
jgi:glutamate-1-semialdehyde 2,1-aminomutase